jgi:hypothetical protein
LEPFELTGVSNEVGSATGRNIANGERCNTANINLYDHWTNSAGAIT